MKHSLNSGSGHGQIQASAYALPGAMGKKGTQPQTLGGGVRFPYMGFA